MGTALLDSGMIMGNKKCYFSRFSVLAMILDLLLQMSLQLDNFCLQTLLEGISLKGPCLWEQLAIERFLEYNIDRN